MEDSEFYKKALELQCFLVNIMADVKACHLEANDCYKEINKIKLSLVDKVHLKNLIESINSEYYYISTNVFCKSNERI